jgi:tripeptidyl-peptidase-1
LYNVSGRAFPDIAAQATNFVVVDNGITYPTVAGTSCASPTAGGVIGLLNDARLAAGKTPLGFLNPLLYEVGSAFTDITAGTNPGCGTVGFTAQAGWYVSSCVYIIIANIVVSLMIFFYCFVGIQ